MLGDFCGCDKKVLAAEVVTMGSLPGWSQKGPGFVLCLTKKWHHFVLQWSCVFFAWGYQWLGLLAFIVCMSNLQSCLSPWSCCILRITLAQACKNIEFVSSSIRPFLRDVQLTSSACADHWIRFRTHNLDTCLKPYILSRYEEVLFSSFHCATKRTLPKLIRLPIFLEKNKKQCEHIWRHFGGKTISPGFFPTFFVHQSDKGEGPVLGFFVTATGISILQLPGASLRPYQALQLAGESVTHVQEKLLVAGSNKRCWFTVKGFSKKNGGGGTIPPKCWVWVQSWNSFERNQLFFWGFFWVLKYRKSTLFSCFFVSFSGKKQHICFLSLQTTWRNHLGLKSCSSTCLEKVGMLCFWHSWSTKETSRFLPCFLVRKSTTGTLETLQGNVWSAHVSLRKC